MVTLVTLALFLLLLIVAVTFRTTTAINTTTTAAASCLTCPKDSTDPDSCGSCTFFNTDFCGWRTSPNAKWAPTDGPIRAIKTRTGGNRAILTSPLMCHSLGDVICLTFTYSFTLWLHGVLSVDVCRDARCEEIFSANRSTSGTAWHTTSVQIIAEGNFKVRFTGVKSDNKYGIESDVYLDNIVYKRGSCDDATPVTPGDNANKPPANAEKVCHYTLVYILASAATVLLLLVVVAVIAFIIAVRRLQEKSDEETVDKKQTAAHNHRANVQNAGNMSAFSQYLTPCSASNVLQGAPSSLSAGSENLFVLTVANPEYESGYYSDARDLKTARTVATLYHIYDEAQ